MGFIFQHWDHSEESPFSTLSDSLHILTLILNHSHSHLNVLSTIHTHLLLLMLTLSISHSHSVMLNLYTDRPMTRVSTLVGKLD
jgi:hypothetical protein